MAAWRRKEKTMKVKLVICSETSNNFALLDRKFSIGFFYENNTKFQLKPAEAP